MLFVISGLSLQVLLQAPFPFQYQMQKSEKWKKMARAEGHYQQALLRRVMAAWKAYQKNIQCLLHQVAQKERDHNRELLR
ncbi:Protein SFI1-like protein, partial [Ophiophagus hannah]